MPNLAARLWLRARADHSPGLKLLIKSASNSFLTMKLCYRSTKVALVLLLLGVSVAFSQTTPASSATATASVPTRWADWAFLMGNWAAEEGAGKPGLLSVGTASFRLDLADNVLVRRSHSEYRSINGRPPVIHEDLMNIYVEDNVTKAIYFDSEGHVIQYVVSFSADKKKIIMLCKKTAESPGFRLTYENLKPGTIKVSFEIAASENNDEFTMYVEGVMNRK